MLDFLLDWIYPPRCLLCTGLIPMKEPRYFCMHCLQKLEPLTEPFCIKCGSPAKDICESCDGRTFAFERNISAFAYDEMLRDMIHQFKYGKHPEYGAGLGRLMAGAVDPSRLPDIQMIIPVPIHKKKQKERGFNQSELLAREVAKAWVIPMDCQTLYRVKYTKPQSDLGPSARENNVKDAFAVNKKFIRGAKSILLIDDIYTTGFTLDACARALRNVGVEKVYCLTLAVALKKH